MVESVEVGEEMDEDQKISEEVSKIPCRCSYLNSLLAGTFEC
jgi:hypothetical protein